MRGSKFFKWLRRVLLLLLLAVLATAGGLYVAASWVPREYHPADLTAQERDAAATDFIEQPLAKFVNDMQKPEPFSISITEERFNAYLASMDEVVARAPDRKGGEARQPGEVRGQMERSGLAEPAVAIGEGVLTIMVRLKEYGKVLSADLSFDFARDGNVQILLREVRLGRLTVPKSLVRGQLEDLRRSLGRSTRSGDDSSRGVSVNEVSDLLAKVISSIDEKPISTELPRKVGGRVLRVDGVDLHDKTLTLRIGTRAAIAASRPL